MKEVIVKVIGNYSYPTSRCLGQGVYGKVYQGIERQTKQKVAVKKIDLNTFTNDKYLQNAIFSQIYLLKRFNHPNIVKFKDVLSSSSSLYIITQYCKNGDLKQLIKRKRFKQDQAYDIMKQLLSGFCQLVRQKIIHRDLKPANILINDGVFKIGDFGFAKYVDNFGTQMLKSCVGSPIYMAPQILQRTQYTTKCDIWSLGVIFFEMIHGYPPWKARDQNQLLKSIKNIPVTKLLQKTNLSQKSTQFLKRTLAFSQEDRIGWAELFQMFGLNSQNNNITNSKNSQQQKNSNTNTANNDKNMHSSQKARVSSHNPTMPNTFLNTNNQNNNNSPNQQQSHQYWTNSNQKPILNSNPSININHHHHNNSNNGSQNTIGSSPAINVQTPSYPSYYNAHHNGTSGSISPERNRTPNYYRDNEQMRYASNVSNNNGNMMGLTPMGSNGNTNNTSTSSATSSNTTSTYSNKRTQQLDTVIHTRQTLVYYHFYCTQLLNNLPNLLNTTPFSSSKLQPFYKLLYILSIYIKNKSTLCLSMIVMHAKVNKNIDDLYKKMQAQHQFYEMMCHDVVGILEKNGNFKSVKLQYNNVVGIRHESQMVSQEKMNKIENYMISCATENAQILSEQVKKRVKNITNRDYNLVQVLDNVLDVLRLAFSNSGNNRGKNTNINIIKDIQEEFKEDDEDIKEFVARVFSKVDRLSAM